MWRDVYQFSLNPEIYLDEANLRSLVERAGLSPREVGPPGLDAALDLLRTAAEEAGAALAFLREAAPGDAEAMALRIMVQAAPMAASLGTWLQGLSAPAVFEDPIQLKFLALLADDVGAGRPGRSRHDAFRTIARRMDVAECAGSARDLVSFRAIRDEMFKLPALFLALSRRSDAFAPELAGIDAGMREIGLLPVFRVLSGVAPQAGEWQRLDLSKPQGGSFAPGDGSPRVLSRALADRLCRDRSDGHRLCVAIAWLARGLADWHGRLAAYARSLNRPRQAMALLIQERAHEASVYHQDHALEGRSLSDWFVEAQYDPFPLLDALARSRLVRPGRPDLSPLAGSLLQPNRPMFRIFRPDDVAVIRRWIESLAAEGSGNAPGIGRGDDTIAAEPIRLPAFGAGDQDLGPVPRNLRHAYFLLQGRALAPRTRAFAADYARHWLELSASSIDRTDRSLPRAWHPGRMRQWLRDQHDKHGHDFIRSRDDAQMPSREAVVDQTLQLAPLTLIDGSWLQGFTETRFAESRVGSPLFEIYWDELGNGDWEINHPKIYRDVLADMGITLPPTGSEEFAADPRLAEASFRLPVYWLCLGKFPVTLRPEILGMNLAMELSGVGGTYRSARRFLRHHGFSTLFVDIHNTIDNVSTGHSAWAVDAIDAHMQAMQELRDPEVEWHRIRTGYESLSPIVRRDGDLDYFPDAGSALPADAAADALRHRPLPHPASAARHD